MHLWPLTIAALPADDRQHVALGAHVDARPAADAVVDVDVRMLGPRTLRS